MKIIKILALTFLATVFSPSARAAPVTLFFDYVAEVQFALDTGGSTPLSGTYSGWVTWDLDNRTFAEAGPNHVQATSSAGCGATFDGVCSFDAGSLPPLVIDYFVDTPIGSFRPLTAYTGGLHTVRSNYGDGTFQNFTVSSSASRTDRTTSPGTATRSEHLFFLAAVDTASPLELFDSFTDLDQGFSLTAATSMQLTVWDFRSTADCSGFRCNGAVYAAGSFQLNGSLVDAQVRPGLAATPVSLPATLALTALGLLPFGWLRASKADGGSNRRQRTNV